MPVRPRESSGFHMVAAAAAAALSASHAACAGPGAPPNHGFNFATITHPGNDPWVGEVGGELRTWGRVDSIYRIATTEVTNAKWFDFVRAAAPFVEPNAQNSSTFTGHYIIRIGSNYVMDSFAANWGVEAGWRYAARFVNWLNNGAPPAGVATAADFATGAYDISTFTQNPNGTLNDQRTRSPGAQYWIPSIDEWAKATYFDPDRYGPGQAGYWLYPGGQDTSPITAPPSQGGQSNVGAVDFPGVIFPLDVGSYPHFNAPWGLLDVSGSVTEWLENATASGLSRARANSSARRPLILDPDHISGFRAFNSLSSINGIRIASAVPSPGAALTVGCALPVFLIRRRRSHVEHHERPPPHLRRHDPRAGAAQ